MYIVTIRFYLDRTFDEPDEPMFDPEQPPEPRS